MHAIPRIAWGDTLRPLRFQIRNREAGSEYSGELVELTSATLQLQDADGVPLPSFETPVACTLVDEREATWTPAYGGGAGEIPAITEVTHYQVLAVLISASGRPWSIRAKWSLRPR